MLICDKHRTTDCYGDIDRLELLVRSGGKTYVIADFDLCGEAVKELLAEDGLVVQLVEAYLGGEGCGPQTTECATSGPGAGSVPGPGPQVAVGWNSEGLQAAQPAVGPHS